jgi:hypothetical protein
LPGVIGGTAGVLAGAGTQALASTAGASTTTARAITAFAGGFASDQTAQQAMVVTGLQERASFAQSFVSGALAYVVTEGTGSAPKLEPAIRQAPSSGPITGPHRVLSPSTRVPNAGLVIRSFVTTQDEVYYRVFTRDARTGSFLTKVRPTSWARAVEGLALPPQNQAQFVQEAVVPAGTRVQRSRALLPLVGVVDLNSSSCWIGCRQRTSVQECRSSDIRRYRLDIAAVVAKGRAVDGDRVQGRERTVGRAYRSEGSALSNLD